MMNPDNWSFEVCHIFHFVPRFKSNYFANGHGFKIQYEASAVSQWTIRTGLCREWDLEEHPNFTTPNGIIIEEWLPDGAECNYVISQQIGTKIKLEILDMAMDDNIECGLDSLEIWDGHDGSEKSALLTKLCVSEIPSPILSTQNNIRIRCVVKKHESYRTNGLLRIEPRI